MACRMYVIPSTLYDSLMTRLKITDDPLLTAQTQLENEKDVILQLPVVDSDQNLAKLADIQHTERVIQEQRTIPTKTTFITQPIVKKEPKVRLIRKTKRPNYITVKEKFYTPPQEKTKLKRISSKANQKQVLKPSILERFYEFEPAVANPEEMQKIVTKTKQKSAGGFLREIGAFSDSPKRIRSGKEF